jgi:hypothetical protein
MKINQIVSEHKKGVKARGYTKKGPEARTVAKQAPQGVATAFAGQVAKEDATQQVYKVTKSDPNTGLTLSKPDGTQLILPPDKMNAIASNPNDPNKYLLNPDAIAQQATSGQPSGPEIGREVEVNADMNPEQAFGEEMDDAGDVGGDATDAYIDGITDHDFEQAQGRLRELAGMPPAAGEAPAATPDSQTISTMPTTEFVKGIYAAAAENGMAAPEVEAVKKQMVLTPEGEVDVMATMQKALQTFQNPEFKQMLADLDALVKQAEAQPMEETNDRDMAEGEKKGLYYNVNKRKEAGTSRDASSPKAPTAQAWRDAAKTAKKESVGEGTADDKLLQKMLTIAGLR